jgi:hypothetical protein
MIDPESWLVVRQRDREREMQDARLVKLLRRPAGGAPARKPTRPIGGTFGRTVGRTLVRVGLWLMVAE